MRRVVVASKNPDKVAEVAAILGFIGGFELVDDVEWPGVGTPLTAEERCESWRMRRCCEAEHVLPVPHF